jgi:succinate dehydrogenase / fumarate reductase flavoprotein subunit
VRGLLVTEGVRGDGGTLRNSTGERFMFRYIPDFFKAETADNEAEADRWYEDKKNRRTPDLLPRDEVARAINAEVKGGRGSPHGGVFLDIATRRSPDYIRRRLPSMYHQFKELAGVDITKDPMEVGPTCHYVMGGVRVDADTTAAVGLLGLFAAGEVAGGMHGSNRLGGNSLSDLLVFGRRAGHYAAEHARASKGTLAIDARQVEAAVREVMAPVERKTGENPYEIQKDLQQLMHTLVGIIRTESELKEAIVQIGRLEERAARVRVEGSLTYNPGWHLALDLQNLLAVSGAIALAALERKESRGGHTRDDYPKPDPNLAKVNIVVRMKDGELSVTPEPLPAMPPELQKLFEEKK